MHYVDDLLPYMPSFPSGRLVTIKLIVRTRVKERNMGPRCVKKTIAHVKLGYDPDPVVQLKAMAFHTRQKYQN